MKKWRIVWIGVFIGIGLLAVAAASSQRQSEPVRIGVLHSLTGSMKNFETPLRDAVLMAVEEINAKGGVLGRRIEPVVVDPASDWPLFAERARQLLTQHKVAVVFGCWSSVSRKSVLPIFESLRGLLFYPVQYEGQEQSPNIFYTGAVPNQQLIPAAEYLMSTAGGSKKKFYLLGTDFVFPRTANMVLKGFLLSRGVPENNIVEEYTTFGYRDYQAIVAKIKTFGRNGDAVVLSTLNAYDNGIAPFYREFANQGLRANQIPVIAFSLGEDELRSMETASLVGHLAVGNYFQSIDTPENRKFVAGYKQYAIDKDLPGGAGRVTDDPIEAAYFGVYAWKAAVERADSFDADKVSQAAVGLEVDGPGGRRRIAANHHTVKSLYIGKIRADGQFEIVWESSTPIEPEVFSPYLNRGEMTPRPAQRSPAPLRAQERLVPVSGRMTGTGGGARSIQIRLRNVGTGSAVEAYVNSSDGSFEFAQVPVGIYTPYVIRGGETSDAEPAFIGVRENGVAGLSIAPRAAAPVTAGPGTASRESSAIANLRTITTAEVTFLSTSGGRFGDIPSLIEAGLLDRRFTVVSDYAFSVIVVGDDYVAAAVPVSAPSGRYGFYTTPDGVVRYFLSEILAPPGQAGRPVQ